MKLLDNKTMKQRAIKIFNAEYKTCHGWQLLWLSFPLPLFPLLHTPTLTTTNKSPKTYGAGAAINSFGIWRRPAKMPPATPSLLQPSPANLFNYAAKCFMCFLLRLRQVHNSLRAPCPCPVSSHFAWLVSSACWIMKDDINTSPQSEGI